MVRVEAFFNFDLPRLRRLRMTQFFCGVILNTRIELERSWLFVEDRVGRLGNVP